MIGAKLAHALQDFGRRIQYSVFECNLTAPQVERLRARVEGLIDNQDDSVRFYLLCGSCRERVEVLGVGVGPEEDPAVYVV